MTRIIAMWSGPRSLSTAMMRSFGSRADCGVMDEPFFAPFLKVTGKDHPGRRETLERHESDPQKVADMCASLPKNKAYSFQKHMPHHMLPDFSMDWAKDAKHFFLIREPSRVIASYVKGRASFDVDDLGFAPQRHLFDMLTEIQGARPPVIESLDILRAPEMALSVLCEAIDIPFDPAMLSWEAGMRPQDGAWAPYWYESVINSTGFAPPPTSQPKIPRYHNSVARLCQKDYDILANHKLQF